MLAQGESVEAHALRERGWTISAIARHLGRNRETIRDYLDGKRVPGVRAPSGPDVFGEYAAYCGQRFADDPHVFATTLFDEVRELGYGGGYSSFTRALRTRGLRPRCEECAQAGAPEEYAIIDHPPGDEAQWDWVELPDPPAWWGWGKTAHLLTVALSYSGSWRGVLAESEEQAYLVACLHGACVRLGGVTRRWRTDRMSTVCDPATGELRASFAECAKYYGVAVDVCPSRRGWRKGVTEKANHTAAQRWWRTLPDDCSPARAQDRLDGFCVRNDQQRTRVREGRKVSVAELAAAEPLRPLPLRPFPAVMEDARVVTAQALVHWHGNQYSVPPVHAGQHLTVRHQLGAVTLDVVTAAGTVLARHRREPDHAGAVVRDQGHVAALEDAVLKARGQAGRPCRRKERRPPSPAAQAQAARIRGQQAPRGAAVTDFTAYAEGARVLRPDADAAGN
jgi:transposase